MKVDVICLEEPAFFTLIDKVVSYIQEKHEPKLDKWISPEDAMKKLNITSKTTLQKFRDEGKIRYSHPEKRIILYDRESIDEFLEKNSQDIF